MAMSFGQMSFRISPRGVDHVRPIEEGTGRGLEPAALAELIRDRLDHLLDGPAEFILRTLSVVREGSAPRLLRGLGLP
jgi:hypothetical protein